MTASIPVDRITQILVGTGYQATGPSVPVASIPFDFAATFVGANHSLDLVVVIDTVSDPSEARLLKKISGLARALDMVGSRRSVTAIVVGPSPSAAAQQTMGRHCRVLVVGTPTGPNAGRAIRDAIAVLLPLDLPQPVSQLADPIAEVRKALGPSQSETSSLLLLAAVRGSREVESVFAKQLKRVLPVDDGLPR